VGEDLLVGVLDSGRAIGYDRTEHVSVNLGTFLAVAFFVVLIGSGVVFFTSVARQMATEPRWRDLYRFLAAGGSPMESDVSAEARALDRRGALVLVADQAWSYSNCYQLKEVRNAPSIRLSG
jgi:hypothetical protein